MGDLTKNSKSKRKGLIHFHEVSHLARNAEFRNSDLKVVMVGDACVGKTCLVIRYMERHYQDSISTIGASFILKTWGLRDIAIWDTAGEEKYAGLTTFYYRNASAAILAFDMFDRTSFYNLQQRYIPILNDVASAQLKVIVATKCDLLNTCERRVSKEEGMELARVSNPSFSPIDGAVPYFETSAKTGENVDELFEFIFNFFYPDGESLKAADEQNDSISLTDIPKTQNRHCC